MSTRGNNPPRPERPVEQSSEVDAGGFAKRKFQLDPVARPNRKPFHFLIADDSAVNRKILGIVLERFGDTVDEAENGLEAVEMVSVQHYDAVFLDIHMPVMGGLEAMAIIRAFGDDRAQTPIFAVTGDTRWEDRAKYLALGADGYIGKPIHIEELELEMDRVLVQKPEIKAIKAG